MKQIRLIIYKTKFTLQYNTNTFTTILLKEKILYF